MGTNAFIGADQTPNTASDFEMAGDLHCIFKKSQIKKMETFFDKNIHLFLEKERFYSSAIIFYMKYLESKNQSKILDLIQERG